MEYNTKWFAENVIGATVAVIGVFIMFIALPAYVAFNLLSGLLSVL